MKKTRAQLLEDVLEILTGLREEWEDPGEITEDTYFLSNLNWQSIDLIVLAQALQDRYEQSFPFTDFLVEIGNRELQDLSVGELVDFLHSHLEEPGSVHAEEGGV